VEIRYLGFEQRQTSRAYQFEVREQGRPQRHLTVTANMDVFRTHGVGIQEGPSLSGEKLTADLASGVEGEHELTGVDVRAHADNKLLAEARRAEMRKSPRRHSTVPKAHELSPWRNSRI
jgi:hypothetical protein